MKKTTIKPSPRAAAVEKKPDVSSELMTLQQVAEYLSCHPNTIYRMLKNRQNPSFRLGFDWRFWRSNIDQWISDRRSGPGAALSASIWSSTVIVPVRWLGC